MDKELLDKVHFVFLTECTSTNGYIKTNADDLENLTAVITENQTKGRGRFDRRWITEPKSGVALSLLLKNIPAKDLSFYPIIASVAVSDALFSLTGKNFSIKWPNDIIYNNRKICGILCESRIRASSCNLIIGIGINLRTQHSFFIRNELEFAGSVLSESGCDIKIQNAVPNVLQYLINICNRFENGEKNDILQSYRSRCVTLGRRIKCENIEGTAEDINMDGSLKVKLDTGEIINLTDASVTVQGLYNV